MKNALPFGRRGSIAYALLALTPLAMTASPHVAADTRYNYTYECTEYYPNGTDCKKTKKVATSTIYHCHPAKEIKKKVCTKVGVGANGVPIVECTTEVETVQDCHE